ncbi:MAG: hypothetical protein ACKOE2_00370 [Actinomycetales bacterium]
MAILFVLLAIAVIALVAMAASGRLGELPEASGDLTPQSGGDGPAFDVVLRGYRMDEVDAAIEGLQRRIDELAGERGSAAEQGSQAPAGP